MRTYLSGFGYCLGTASDIDELITDGDVAAETALSLKSRGIAKCCRSNRSSLELCRTSLANTRDAGPVAFQKAKALFLLNSNEFGRDVEPAALVDEKLSGYCPDIPCFVIQRRECSGLEAGISMAKDGICKNRFSSALILTYGRVESERSRLSQDSSLIVGDGAASCVLSRQPSGLEVIDAFTIDDDRFLLGENKFDRLSRQLKALTNAVGAAYERARVPARQIRYLLATNGSKLLLSILARAAQIPIEHVYFGGLTKFGHAFSCDNLVSLRTMLSNNMVRYGDYVLLISWSPRVLGVAIIRVAI